MKNIFKRTNKEIENKELGLKTISLTFKMPITNFFSYFKVNHNWIVKFSDEELNKIDKAIKQIKKGNPQDLIFEDGLKLSEVKK